MFARKALAGTAAAPKVFVEDVFSCTLYSGTGASQTITNNIDLSGEGGLVWGKMRNDSGNHFLQDTERGTTKSLTTNNTDGDGTTSQYITAFNNNGFTLGTNLTVNGSTYTYASWTFRKAEKFFDIVTYTGNGANRTIAHNLGSVPGCIIVKRTDTTGDWQVYHRANTANPETDYLVLNTTAATADSDTRWNDTLPTSTVFSLGTDATVNANSGTYVAYLFAHDAGGFGDAGSDNVISCGSCLGNATVDLGWEPQFLMIKASSTTGNWEIFDNMRGFTVAGQADARLRANLSDAEVSSDVAAPTATGFTLDFSGATTYVYIAIRRGPMAVPTLGTSVFSLDASSAGGSGGLLGAITASDLVINSQRDPAANSPFVFIDRLRGVGQVNTGATTKALYSSNTNAETTVDTTSSSSTAEGVNGAYLYSAAGKSSAIRTVQQGPGGSVAYNLIRAPGFFDVVCYTGTGSATTVSHNLGVAPELMIVKRRGTANAWAVYANNDNTDYLVLNTTAATVDDNTYWNDTSPTSSVFSVGTNNATNASGSTYVAYLFASLTGVSSVGSYTGNGSSVTVTTNFQPRFILVKRTDSTGNWIVGDSARGLVAGNDPYLLLNSTAAEDTDEDWVDITSTSFTVNQTTAANANVNTGTYIYLAVS